MPEVTGAQIIAFVDGGSANKGQDVYFTMEIDQGGPKSTVTFFVAADRLGEFIAALATFGGMARNTRLSKTPQAEADGQFAGADALALSNAMSGISVSTDATGLLTLQFAAAGGRLLNTYIAADRSQLIKLREVCDASIAMLDKAANEPGSIPKIN